jgi:hypothetical protein
LRLNGLLSIDNQDGTIDDNFFTEDTVTECRVAGVAAN